MADTPAVYCLATMDTKGEEITFVAERLRAAGVEVRTVDLGTAAPPTVQPDVARERVLAGATLPRGDRGLAVTAMSAALVRFLTAEHAAGRVLGAIGLGGSGGTALIAPALRALPIGLPKLVVSTVASGDTAPYIGTSDLLLVPSVVDVAGLNRVSRRVLANAAHALAGMVRNSIPASGDRPCVGLTMFGVTTPCVTAVRTALETAGFDGLVFHATGTGGRAMESLVRAGLITGVLDLTTTEVADRVAGGIWPCHDDRFAAALEARVPHVLSLGAGRGSLAGLMAYGNANDIVVDMAKEVLTAVGKTPVLAGVNGTDPFMLRDRFLRQLLDLGFAGVQNFPTVGLIDGVFRQNLEETGMSYGLEVEMIAAAARLGLLTTPYVFDPDQARAMAQAGADILVAHLGLTTKGSIGAHTAKTLESCVGEVERIIAAARAVRPDILVLCHGGPVAEPEDARFVLSHVPACDGFYGASSMERLPTEKAIAEQVRAFAAVRR